jgi:hypothetical protein
MRLVNNAPGRRLFGRNLLLVRELAELLVRATATVPVGPLLPN